MWQGLRGPLIIACVLALCACAAAPVEDIEPGADPAPDSDEAGLWMMMEKAERRLITSGQLVEDPALQDYVGGIACRLAPEYCDDIRVYVVEQPDFNATMAPNGFMTVWTGLILRCENEAQLATVIGHEIAHYRYRHSLLMWRSMRASSDAWMLVNLAIGASGSSGSQAASAATQALMMAGLMSFSREHEREADTLGFQLVSTAGYDTREAARIWDGLIAEREAAEADDPPVLFASHPPSPERSQTLRDMARELGADAGRERGSEAFLEMTLAHRGNWLAAELRRRRFARVQVVLDRLIEQGSGLGELYFQQGQLYRLRDADGDVERAIGAYERALTHPDAPAATHRALGFVQWSQGRHEAARRALEGYLREAPEAGDRAMIESYLEELQ